METKACCRATTAAAAAAAATSVPMRRRQLRGSPAAAAAAVRWPLLLLALAALAATVDGHSTQFTTYYADCKLPSVGIQDDDGVIYSPNYGVKNGTRKLYPASCSLLIGIDGTSPIQILFDDFDMSVGDYCLVTDVIATSRTYTFTGSSLPSLPLLSKSLSVRFFSNGDNQTSRGFVLRWTTDYASLPTTTLAPLTADATYIYVNGSNAAYIQSPGFPSLYPFSLVKDWVITVPQDAQIALDFLYFYTEETRDHLKVLDGYAINAEVLIGDYSGDLRKKLPNPVISSTPRVHLRFLTDGTTRYNGFNIRCKIYDPNDYTATVAPMTVPMTVALTTTTAQSGLDQASLISLSVILSLLIVSAFVAGVVYVNWYQPRKLRYARQEALKRYAAMKEEYERQAGSDQLDSSRPASARPGSARPGSARPGSARPGSAVPGRPVSASPGSAVNYGTARPTSARPGSAMRLGGARPTTARQTLETVLEGTSAMPTGVGQRPTTAGRLRHVTADLQSVDEGRSQPFGGFQPGASDRLLLSPEALRGPYQALNDSPGGEFANDDEGDQYQDPLPSIASLVGTKRSSRIKAPPQILVNDGFIDDNGEDIAQGVPRDGRGAPSRLLPPVRALPPLTDGPHRLSPLTRPGMGLLSPRLAVTFQASPQMSTKLGSIAQSQVEPALQQVANRPLASPKQSRTALTGGPPEPSATESGSSVAEATLTPRPTSASMLQQQQRQQSRPSSASGGHPQQQQQRPGSATRTMLPSAPFYDDDDTDMLNGV